MESRNIFLVCFKENKKERTVFQKERIGTDRVGILTNTLLWSVQQR